MPTRNRLLRSLQDDSPGERLFQFRCVQGNTGQHRICADGQLESKGQVVALSRLTLGQEEAEMMLQVVDGLADQLMSVRSPSLL